MALQLALLTVGVVSVNAWFAPKKRKRPKLRFELARSSEQPSPEVAGERPDLFVGATFGDQRAFGKFAVTRL